MHNLAALYGIQGKYAKAGPLFTQVLNIMENKFGKDHSKIVPILENLAECYWKMNKKHKADELEERVFRIRQKLMPNNSTLIEI